MSRHKVLAGNWKMNKLNVDVGGFVENYAAAAGKSTAVTTLICPPYTLLQTAVQAARLHGYLVVSQNVHAEAKGAFTGEISIPMLKEIGVNGAVVGHSERRQYFAETDHAVGVKAKTLQAAGMWAICCIGETKDQRVSGETMKVVGAQMDGICASLTSLDKIMFAYEPVWAIGTGLNASDEQAQEVHAFVRGRLAEKYGAKAADDTSILYGGSVKSSNIKGLISQKDIDGGLVGGASLEPAEFAAIFKGMC
jgi:triosephosphate isomerase